MQLARALKREQADAQTPPLTPEAKNEVEQIDALIQQCLAACRRGMVRNGKANPAYRILSGLIKSRKLILESKRPPASAQDILASLDKLFATEKGPAA